MLYVDALASFWREWVINYDVGHQYNLGREATRNSLEWLQRARDWARRHHEALLDAARRTRGRFLILPRSGAWPEQSLHVCLF